MPAAIDWTEELQNSILDCIESGLTLRQTAKRQNISDSLILKHVRDDPEFCKHYVRALDIRKDRDFEGLEDELNETPAMVSTKFGEMVDAGWVAWKRVQIDTRKWALSKRDPKKYGDRIASEVSGNIQLGVQLVHSIPRPERDNDASLQLTAGQGVISGELD